MKEKHYEKQSDNVPYLLCKHSFQLLNYDIRNHNVIPYRLLNCYDWDRIEKNINTLITTFNRELCFNCFNLLTLHPETLKSRVELVKRIAVELSDEYRYQLLNISVSRLKIVSQSPKIIKNIKTFNSSHRFFQRLQACSFDALELFQQDQTWLDYSNDIEKMNLFYYSQYHNLSDLSLRFKKYCSYLIQQCGIRAVASFFLSKRGVDCLEKIFFDPEIFQTVDDLFQFLNKFQSIFQIVNDKSTRSIMLTFLPSQIQRELIMWERSIPPELFYSSSQMTDFLLGFSDDEVHQVWTIIQKHRFNMIPFFYRNVKILTQLINFSNNFEVSSTIEHFENILAKYPNVLMNHDAKEIHSKWNFIKGLNLLSTKIEIQLLNFDQNQLNVISENLTNLKKWIFKMQQIDLFYLKKYSPNELNYFFNEIK